MKAKLISHDYYEVSDGDKWYTAKKLPFNDLYFVVNHKGRPIRQGSIIHRRVVAAVSDLQNPYLP